MSVYRLGSAFQPQSIALVGASENPDSLGHAILNNLRRGEFAGPVGLVNPRYKQIDGLPCAASLDELPLTPELIVVATPAPTIPGIIESAARRGVHAAVIISAGLGHGPGSLAEQINAMARAHGLRIIGPNSIGLISPYARLNASFAGTMPQPGGLAVISQSGAIAAAMSEWGIQHHIGFSAIASVGDQLDADIGDLLDYFVLDHRTQAILLYIESVKDARKFMSAARAAARIKPVVAIKAGRHAHGARAAATHTGALAGADGVYDAAFRRAGLLRVYDMAELFAAAETLGHFRSVGGNRLAILTNGGGLGILAVDRLADFGYAPAALSEATQARLNAAMSSHWSRSNPVDIVGDADADRYALALQTLIDDPANDAVLVLNVETAMASSADTARAVCDVIETERSRRLHPKPVFASWVGADSRIDAIFRKAHMPHYPSEAEAVRGFVHLVQRTETNRALMATPPALPDDGHPDDTRVRGIVQLALQDNRDWLDPVEVSDCLAAYGISSTPILSAATPEGAAQKAKSLIDQGQLIAVKILSRDIRHKSDVDGVKLNLSSVEAVREAAATVMASAKHARPDARIEGVIIQPMITRRGARELIAGFATDPTFGPVILFGQGGIATEVIKDTALALPPLDLKLADELIGRTRVSRILGAYRNVPAARRDEIAKVLVRLSQLAADIPEIREIDINPLLADQSGVLALDARITIAPVAATARPRYTHLAIRPYPKEWERMLTLRDGRRVFVRPVRAEDDPIFEAFFRKVTASDLRLRFFAPVKDFSHAFIARLTQIDYGRAMAFVAFDEESGEMMGAVRLHADPDYQTGEYAILLRSDLKGRGLGWALMQMIIDYARKEGLRNIEGEVLRDNSVMLQMCQELGFDVRTAKDDSGMMIVTLDLTANPPSGSNEAAAGAHARDGASGNR